MSAIIPFDGSAKLPAYLANRADLSGINADVVTAAAFPTMSIMDKQFAIVRDGLSTTLMKPAPDDDEVAQKIEVAVLRANMHSRVFYAKKYDDADNSSSPPDCFTMDGVKPSAGATNKQAEHCATCPHSVWGTGNTERGTGRACGDKPRIAIAPPDNLGDAMLLRVPAASIKNWKDAVKIAKTRNIPYNALVYRISFDREAATPLLQFKPVGLLDDASYTKASTMYDGELVRSIAGLDEAPPRTQIAAPVVPAAEVDELDAAIAAKQATKSAAATSKATTKVTKPVVTEDELDAAAPPPVAVKKPVVKPPAPAPAPAPAGAPASDNLLDGLDDLLGSPDD